MRKPHPEDYAPDYKPDKGPAPEAVDLGEVVPIKAKPHTDSLLPAEAENDQPAVVPDGAPPERTEERPHDRTDFRSEQRTEERSENRTVDALRTLPLKRPTKRHSFEFYEDQLIRLKQLKIKAELAGEGLSQSAMVRIALDAYLQGQDLK